MVPLLGGRSAGRRNEPRNLQAAERNLEAQLVGPRTSQIPNPNHKPLEAALEKKLRAVP